MAKQIKLKNDFERGKKYRNHIDNLKSKDYNGDVSRADSLPSVEKTSHANERIIERKVNAEDIDNTLKNYLYKSEKTIDNEGRPSIKYIGEKVTVIWNPDKEKVVTVWPTSSRIRKKYRKDE